MTSKNNKRIAKNTGMLYIRMLLIMAVSLYTTRIVLSILGIEDYGIYTIVGGVVTMFSFLNSAMARASQRFLSFELGRKDYKQLARVFSISINIHVTIAVIILILAETIGLWFLNTQLNIPAERMNAANWVYHFSIFAFFVTIINVPYNATIIAHERMNIYAYIGILEVVLKLIIVIMLKWLGFDKLKLYAVLVFAVSLLIRLIYYFYCRINFKESHYHFFWDKKLYKTLLSFTGWNLWGNFAVVTFNQGNNILLNIFFGPVVNAARGIAYQVNGAVSAFIVNFQLALNPPIVKSYGNGDLNYMHQLIFQGAKYSFFLLYFLSLPILIETEIILKLWLKVIPDYSIIFCRLVIISSLIECVSGTLITAAQASGKIKLYQTVVGGLLLLILPFSYIFLKMGYPPQIILYITIFFSIIVLIARLLIVRSLINLSLRKFSEKVFYAILLVTPCSMALPYYIYFNLKQGILRFLIVSIISFLSILISVYFFGISSNEKNIMLNKAKNIWEKIKV